MPHLCQPGFWQYGQIRPCSIPPKPLKKALATALSCNVMFSLCATELKRANSQWSVLAPLVKLDDAEREFTNRVNAGELSPELLFPNDNELADRLKRHPALQWKIAGAPGVGLHRRNARFRRRIPLVTTNLARAPGAPAHHLYGRRELCRHGVREVQACPGVRRGFRCGRLRALARTLNCGSTVDWLKTARNLVKLAGADRSYREVENT